MKIKKNDLVKVISGKEKGKIGRIKNIYTNINCIEIEDVGSYKKHLKPRASKKYPEGGIIKLSKKINSSNVLFYSKKLNKAFKIGYKIDIKNNKYRIFKGKNAPTEPII